MVTFLPCISMGQIAHRIQFNTFWKVILALVGLQTIHIIAAVDVTAVAINGRPILSDFFVKYYELIKYSVALIFGIYTFRLRRRVRQLFRIRGSDCDDCVMSICCNCCVLAQMASQVQSYSSGVCSISQPDPLHPSTISSLYEQTPIIHA